MKELGNLQKGKLYYEEASVIYTHRHNFMKMYKESQKLAESRQKLIEQHHESELVKKVMIYRFGFVFISTLKCEIGN